MWRRSSFPNTFPDVAIRINPQSKEEEDEEKKKDQIRAEKVLFLKNRWPTTTSFRNSARVEKQRAGDSYPEPTAP